MGCALTKKEEEEEEDVVALCRERKRLLKLAVERRYAFADAHCKYNQSLYAVAMAIRLFVARHSSASSPFLITFPCSGIEHGEKNPSAEPVLLKQTPTEATHQGIPCPPPNLASSKLQRQEQETAHESDGDEDEEENSEEEDEEEEESGSEDSEVPCEHFYDQVVGTQKPPSPRREFAWDFFNPFDEVRGEMVNGLSQSSEEDLRAVREKEGIPELEEDGDQRVISESKGEKFKKNGDMGHEKGRNLELDGSSNGRELLEALKDIEDHFVRAYDSGLDISRMLEVNRVPVQSGLEENSKKLIRSLTWSRSASFRSSSGTSLLTSSSMNSSMWTESKLDVFDGHGMESGSHSLTLGRLYLWEKKLFHEVKTGDQNQKLIKRKCSRLRTIKSLGDGLRSKDRSADEITELHTSIIVAIRSAESISNTIQKLRDEELQPQLLELLHGLMRNWKMMLESHQTQNRVMLEVKLFNCPAYGKFSNNSHRLATLQLEAELDNWRNCFAAYMLAQKTYIEALSGWLSKFVAPEAELYSRSKSSTLPWKINGPPLLGTCHSWLACLEELPDKAVTSAMKSFRKDIRAIWSHQGEEQQQKRKVDRLAKELEKKTLAFQRAERRVLESKISEQEPEAAVRDRIEYLAGRQDLVDVFRKKLDAEKENHLTSMQATKIITIAGLQTGFSSVFESLVEFSKAAMKMYADLVTYNSTDNRKLS